MNVYVAGRLDERDRVRRIQEMIRDVGWHITYDWTEIKDVPSSKFQPYTGRAIAMDERQGVFDADLVVLCHSPTGMKGCLIEVGMALGHYLPVVVLDSGKSMSIFWYLDEVILLTTDEFPSWLAKLTTDGTVTLRGSRSRAMRLGHS